MRTTETSANVNRARSRAELERRLGDMPFSSTVRIEDVCVHPSKIASEPRAVCAAVCLPNLLPTDVVVELSLDDASGTPIGVGSHRRMWSEQAYDFDRFMFVVRVRPDDLAAAAHATVTVRPRHPEATDPRATSIHVTIPLRVE